MIKLKDKFINEEEFINEGYKVEINSLEELNEALITLGGKAYPKFGNVVIMAGGAGVGKGYIQSNLLGIDGKTFDVDKLKEYAMETPKIKNLMKKEFSDRGWNLDDFSLKNPDHVSLVHYIIGDKLNLPKTQQNIMFANIVMSDPSRKPNLIFDVTLKNIKKLDSISKKIEMLGYDKDKTHIVWVVNDVDVAKAQNLERDRTVPEDVLIDTHEGVAQTMFKLSNNFVDVRKYADGDIWFVFNQKGVDSIYRESKRGGSFVERPNMFKIKEAGEPINKKMLTKKIKQKIKEYVPKQKGYWS